MGAGYESDPGPNRSNIGVGLLNEALTVEIGGVSLPLLTDGSAPGLLYLGQAGALNGYAAAESATSASAATGVVDDSGAIDLSLGGDPSNTDFARVNLTDLTTQLGVDLDDVVDEISLGLGALASSASQTTGREPESDYVVAGAELVINSPAVGALVGALDTTIEGLNSSINDDLIGEEGLISGALADATPIDVNLDLGFLADLGVELDASQVSLDVGLGSATAGLLDEPLVSDRPV